MNEIERRILDTLQELDHAVKSIAAATTKPNLIPFFERINALRSELPKTTDAQLLHYLHKQSYEKARLWLEGRDAENAAGSCSH